MAVLLDTCILVDLSRGNQNALAFLKGMEARPAVSVLTITEFLGGIKREDEKQFFERLLARWDTIDVNVEIARKAAEFVHSYRASHSVDVVDGLIAATAVVHDIELATLNLKHFPMFPGLKRPY